MIELSRPLARHPMAPVIVAAAYLCSVLVVLPRPVLTVPAVLVFGPWLTFFSGMSGLILGALCGFGLGRELTGEKLENISRSPLFGRVKAKIRGGGVGTVVVVRLVPIAPFTVMNMLLGVLRVRTGDFVLGTFLGLLPGFLLSIFIGDRLRRLLYYHGTANWTLIGVQVLGAAIVLFLLWRMASAKFQEPSR
jgi:uncharacterized membrane protein YdjX (TVP38/TMEM64 family)